MVLFGRKEAGCCNIIYDLDVEPIRCVSDTAVLDVMVVIVYETRTLMTETEVMHDRRRVQLSENMGDELCGGWFSPPWTRKRGLSGSTSLSSFIAAKK
jgi:hypothetical protein